MKFNNRQRTFYTFSLSLILFCSCKKFVEIDPPKTQLTNETVFGNDNTANSAVAGIYSNMCNNSRSVFNGLYTTIFCGLMADELQATGSLSNQYASFQNNSLLATNKDVSIFWQNMYNNIYAANMVLENLAHSNTISVSMNKQLTGESLFLRSLCYFYLAQLFGDVPLVLSTQVNETTILPRAPVEKVQEQIIGDLNNALTLLVSDYSYSNGERVRGNKSVVNAFLARVYLFVGKWQEAEISASNVINDSADYALEPTLSKVFWKNSSESILQFYTYNGSGYTYTGQRFIPTSGGRIPNYLLTDVLMNSFEENDQRKTTWIDSVNVNSEEYYYPGKYEQSTIQPGESGEYDMVFRLSEQFLIRAEARAQQGNIAGAASDLNRIRGRAGLAPATATDENSMLAAILHERQVELFTEWGHRWLDLKRTGTIDNVLSVEKAGWKSTAAFYPIPQVEIGKNNKLTQNAGY